MNGVADAKIDLHGLTYVVEARMKTNASTDILSRVANRLHGYRRRLQDDTVRRIGNCRALFDESYECCLVFFLPTLLSSGRRSRSSNPVTRPLAAESLPIGSGLYRAHG